MNAVILNIPPVAKLTDEQFYHICQANRDFRFERSAIGDLIIMPPIAKVLLRDKYVGTRHPRYFGLENKVNYAVSLHNLMPAYQTIVSFIYNEHSRP